MGADVYGGEPEKALPAAVAVEVFHNFTLLHDDIMDKAELRRGRPAVHLKWGESGAILSGDAMVPENCPDCWRCSTGPQWRCARGSSTTWISRPATGP